MRGARGGPFRDLPPEVAVLTAVSFTVALGFGIVAPVIPAFARQFGVSVAVAASVISVFALMRVVGALPAGRLVDRFGEPGVMAAGIAVVAVSSVLAGFSQSFVELLALRGSGGVGSAMFSISAQALLLGSVPGSQRGRASGLFSGGFLLGGISGPAVGGLVAAWSLRAPFFIYGFLLVVPAALAAGVLRHTPNRRREAAARRRSGCWPPWATRCAAAPGAPRPRPTWPTASPRWACAAPWCRCSSGRCCTFGGLDRDRAPVVRRAERRRACARRPGGGQPRPSSVVIAGCLISAVGMVTLALLHGPEAYLAAMAVAGFGSGLLDVAPAAMIGDIIGPSGGTLVASYQMAGDVGSVTGPVAGGMLVDSASYGAAFGLAAAVLSGAALLGLISPETRSDDPAPLPPRSPVGGPDSRIR